MTGSIRWVCNSLYWTLNQSLAIGFLRTEIVFENDGPYAYTLFFRSIKILYTNKITQICIMVIEFDKYSFQIQMPRKIKVNSWYLLYEYKIIISAK